MSSAKSVVVVGGGISGLAASLIMRKTPAATNRLANVTLLESASRLGGQIKTERLDLPYHTGPLIIEAGAEGFVTRSTLYPQLAEYAGIPNDSLVNQKRIADCELSWNSAEKRWDVIELEPGVAAQKLGFQVPKEDRGRGIRSFRNGMSQLVDNIAPLIVGRLETEVVGIERDGEKFVIHTSSSSGENVILADGVILATPARIIKDLLSPLGIKSPLEQPPHHSHVSVHVLIPTDVTHRTPSSFTVPADKQAQFGGLRACSLVNEKFTGRSDENHQLFRFYFRPETEESVKDEALWVERAHNALDEIFGLKDRVLWSHFAPWSATLPSFTSKYTDQFGVYKEEVDSVFRGKLKLAGAEVTGAGLEAAAQSGVKAANEILTVF